ncbi:hypothetical protein [Caldisalinibacter kiritimatiensis]|uniref:Hydroxymyristoyl-ACP dehydratase n=1 Tax=Caldisalinibacter kiritimatiensis TaxID=1304284 RepID=R1CDX4_9FIRM|nr:hypothetical protein [Caldisalinibacter kiritimatiensis]EOD00475.1 hypothetical protein L21TH_1476 [Caldisalinibacter kiritimatiensis]
MTINCSENCIYQNDGICTLTYITKSAGTIKSNCPYYREKEDYTKLTIENIEQDNVLKT